MQQRGIPEDALDLILEYGTPHERPGNAVEYVVHKTDRQRIVRRLKRLLRRVDSLDGKAVLVGTNGEIITVYHTAG